MRLGACTTTHRRLWTTAAPRRGAADAGGVDLIITRPGLVVPLPAGAAGGPGPTHGQARGPRWRRVSKGFYVPTDVSADSTEQRIVEAVAGLPAGALVTGWAALHWQGARFLSGREAARRLPVPVAVGDRRFLSRRPGVEIGFDWLFDDDAEELDGLPITSAARSISWAAQRARSLLEAVTVVDMAAVDDLVSLDEMWHYATRLSGRPGVVRLRAALRAADENTWSPMETLARLRWASSGLPRPRTNVPIFDEAGRHVATPDLLDPAAGVAGEYDGRVHDTEQVRRRDHDAEDHLRDLGLEVVRLNSGRPDDVEAFTRRLHAAYERAARRPAQSRWTTRRPAWWVDTSSVAARRALTPAQRSRWLRWRS